MMTLSMLALAPLMIGSALALPIGAFAAIAMPAPYPGALGFGLVASASPLAAPIVSAV